MLQITSLLQDCEMCWLLPQSLNNLYSRGKFPSTVYFLRQMIMMEKKKQLFLLVVNVIDSVCVCTMREGWWVTK